MIENLKLGTLPHVKNGEIASWAQWAGSWVVLIPPLPKGYFLGVTVTWFEVMWGYMRLCEHFAMSRTEKLYPTQGQWSQVVRFPIGESPAHWKQKQMCHSWQLGNLTRSTGAFFVVADFRLF